MDVFREEKFELLALTKTKLKRNGEVSWYGVNGIIASVQEMESASSKILCMKFKFSMVKVCVVVWYGPNEGDGEERDRFWIE